MIQLLSIQWWWLDGVSLTSQIMPPYIICINCEHDSCVHVIYIYIINSDSMTLDDVSQRRYEVQKDEELEDDDALDDIFVDDKNDFCEGYLNEIDSWSRIFELSRE